MCCVGYYEQHVLGYASSCARVEVCSRGYVFECLLSFCPYSCYSLSALRQVYSVTMLNLCRYSRYFLISDRLFNSCHYPCHSLLLKFSFLFVTICRCMPKFLSLSSLLIFDLTYVSVLSLFLSVAIYFYLSPGLSVFM